MNMKLSTSRVSLVLSLAATTALAYGCGKKDPAPAAPAVADVAAPTPDGPGTGGEEAGRPRRDPEPTADAPPSAPAAASASVLEAGPLARAPRDTPFAVVARPAEVLGALGYTDLLKANAEVAAELIQGMVEVTGTNLFETGAWGDIGIDLSRPAGVFGLDLRPSALILFVAVSDAKKLEEFIVGTAKRAGAEFSLEKVGEHTLLTIPGQDRGAVLITADAVYTVTLLRGTGASGVAKELAQREAGSGLLDTAEYKAIVAGVAAPDAGVYFRFGELIERATADTNMLKGPLEGFESQLEEARKAGDAARVAELEREVEYWKEYGVRWARREAAERGLLAHVSKGMSALAAGADFGPEGIDVSLRVPLAANSTLGALMVANPDIIQALKVSAEPPLLVAGGRLDAKRFMQIFEMMLAAEGAELDELRGHLKEAFAIDFDADLAAQLSGEVAFAITGNLREAFKSDDPSRTLGGTLALGVTNPEAARAVLARLGGLEVVKEIGSFDAESGVLTIRLPEGRDLAIAVSGNWFVIATDASVGARLGAGETFLDRVKNAKLRSRLGEKGLSTMYSMQLGFVLGWLFVGGTSRGPWGGDAVEGEPEDKQKIRAELQALEAEIAPLRAKVEEARMRPFLDALDKLGNYAQTTRVGPAGLEMTLGLYPEGATLAEAVAAVVSYAMSEGRGAPPSPDEEKLRELENKRWDLERQLWQAPPDKVEWGD